MLKKDVGILKNLVMMCKEGRLDFEGEKYIEHCMGAE